MTSSNTDASSVTSPMCLAFLEEKELHAGEEQVTSLYTEDLAFSDAGAVVPVARVTQARSTFVNGQVTHARVEVKGIAINKMTDAVPLVRKEGDITIIPVVEEVVVVEQRLLLKERVRSGKVQVMKQYLGTTVLPDQDVVVTCAAPDDGHIPDMPQTSTT